MASRSLLVLSFLVCCTSAYRPLPIGRDAEGSGTTWAVLVAGSNGFGNYRHQADVCHAYQILKKGGIKEENIVVFMYDDIANNSLNPRPGVIINRPDGGDVYAGVPKDYTGENVTVHNLFAVLLGEKDALTGGSGKVVDSKPEDRIFFYYADHGGPGALCMPSETLYANDLVDVLKLKHTMGTYKEMVIYVEACESGSIFEGLLPNNISIYAMTAANATESSWGTYCPGMTPPPPPEYETCLGDLFSVAWMEDSDAHDPKKETIEEQYERVKERTSMNQTFTLGSHVMEFGSDKIKAHKLYLYQGTGTAAAIDNNVTFEHGEGLVNQRDAELDFLMQRYKRLDDGSEEKAALLEEIEGAVRLRVHIDRSVAGIGELLFGVGIGPSVLAAARPRGEVLVDDWDCLKSTVKMYERHCGALTQYGMKHMRAFANLCNFGVRTKEVEKACKKVCGIKTYA